MQTDAETGAGTPTPETLPDLPCEILNWIDMCALEVDVSEAHSSVPALAAINLHVPGCSISMRHNMTASQCRKMAAAMIAAANWLDAQPVPINEQSR